MRLTRAEFESRYNAGELRLALIGMSNIGKSYTALRLATALDFSLIEIDRLIWESLGQDSMEDFAQWQGQPYSDGYADREARSIALENEATAKALDMAKGNAILDTTGSVIYTSKDVQEKISKHWYIVHISATDADMKRLKSQYFRQPKPLIWNGQYRCRDDQTVEDAILQSYNGLLMMRSKAYAALADATIGSDVVLNPQLSPVDIFERLKPTR